MKEAKITGSNFRMMFVQCSRCGGVVGVTEFTNTAATLHNISKKLGI
jgi:translation initiation factor 2 beta subunit (eIF-2beta)/eIF-5